MNTKSLKAVSETDFGIDFLKGLMEYCGWQESGVPVSTIGVIDQLALIRNECLRDVWGRIRKEITYDKLRLIENPEPSAKNKKVKQEDLENE